MASQSAAPLTQREQEILSLIARGLDSRQIAFVLGIAYFTVRKHRSNMLGKLGLTSAAQLAALAVAVVPDLTSAASSRQTGPGSARASSRLPTMWQPG